MAEAAQDERWQHTAALLALTANCHRDPRRQRAVRPADFLPQPPAASTPRLTDLSILKSVFVDRHLPE